MRKEVSNSVSGQRFISYWRSYSFDEYHQDTEVLESATNVFQHIGLSMKIQTERGFYTREHEAEIYNVKKGCTFEEMFGYLGRNLDDLCLTQTQIVDFCKNNKFLLKRRIVTYFLFKVGDQFFVASVSFMHFHSLFIEKFGPINGWKDKHWRCMVVRGQHARRR